MFNNRQLSLLSAALTYARINEDSFARHFQEFLIDNGADDSVPVTDDEIDALELAVSRLVGTDMAELYVHCLNEATMEQRSDGRYTAAQILPLVPIVGRCEHIIPSVHYDLFLVDPGQVTARLVMTYFPTEEPNASDG